MISLKNKITLAFLLLVSMTLIYCKAAHKSAGETAHKHAQKISYAKDIAPIITQSCSPCHFPAEGKKEPLDNYAAVKEHISDMLVRVQLPATDIKFMPFKSKKPALTEAEIKLMKDWVAQNMPQ